MPSLEFYEFGECMCKRNRDAHILYLSTYAQKVDTRYTKVFTNN